MGLDADWLRRASAFAFLVVAFVVAACSIRGGSVDLSSSPVPTADSGASPAAPQPVKVALLLPLTSTSQTEAVANAMKQAAELAVFELNNPNLQLIIKDDAGTSEGAQKAAEEAIQEGAELILGPLFAASVRAVGPVAQQAGSPVLAFSNDGQVAGNGVYLLGFMPQQEVRRVANYALAQGHRRFAAFVSEDAYGQIVEAAFREAVTSGGGTIVAVERYPATTNAMVAPAERIVAAIREADEAGQPIDALFVPGNPETLPRLGPLLSYANLDTSRVKLLGTGGWDLPNLGRNAVFVGGWFASPEPRGWRDFSERFARTYGMAPPRIASIAYDAISIAAQFANAPSGARFTMANLTRPTGFAGVDGPIRLLPSGLAERGLAVLEVQPVGATVIDPPTGFGSPVAQPSAESLN